MRRLPWVLAFVFIAGCADDPKQPEPQPRRQAVAQPQPQPQAQQPAQPADPPADEDNTPIVIKGSKKSDSGPKESDAARQKRIEELKAQAAASQGQDNGPTYRESPGTDPTTKPAAKKDLKAQIANLDERIKALQEQKRNLPTTPTRHGPVITDKDQEASLNQQINELEQQKIQLLQQAPDAPSAGK
ncbi:MAG TPA: hypothetical protein VFF73_17545 [Planctomycetota bacterium]|nr:hypothetical protein [Planctomycetota bacterium]